MRSKLCIILPILFTIFLPSFGISLNVNALKYPIGNFPIMHDTMNFDKLNGYYVYYNKNLSDFSISLLNNEIPSGFTFPHVWQFGGVYQVSNSFPNGQCTIPLSGPLIANDSYYNDGVLVDNRSSYTKYSYNYQFLYDTDNVFFDYSNLSFGEYTPFVSNSPFHSQGSWASDHRDSFCNMYESLYQIDPSQYPNVSSNLPAWHFGSLATIPELNHRQEYYSSSPYTYAFNYINFTQKDYVDGAVVTRDGIPFDDIFNSNVRSFTDLSFDLPIFDTIQSTLDSDRVDDISLTETVYNFSINGSIQFSSDFTLNSQSNIKMTVEDYYVDEFDPTNDLSNGGEYDEDEEVVINNHLVHNLEYLSNYTHSIDCSYTEYHISDGADSNRLDFSCYYDPVSSNPYSNTVNFHFIDIIMRFSGSNNNFVSTTGSMTFSDFYVITNNNNRPGAINASAGHILTGGDIDSAPGQEGWQDQAQASYDEALRGLFNFTFVNPFTPIFALFTDQATCAYIPTIAGMLHSNETTVCSWFSSETRSIATPVIGMVSMMLVFGFAVRWLGSTSGNMFEDSGHIIPGVESTQVAPGRYKFSRKGWKRSK